MIGGAFGINRRSVCAAGMRSILNGSDGGEQQTLTFTGTATTTGNLTSTTTTTSFRVSLSTNASQQFSATTASDSTAGGALRFGGATGPFSSCVWWPVSIDLYKPPTATVTGASWSSGSGGVVTFTYSTTGVASPFAAGDTVQVTGASPSAYEGTYAVLASPAPSATTFAPSLKAKKLASSPSMNSSTTMA